MDYVCPTLLCWLLSDFVNQICLIFYSQQLVWILKHFQILSPLIVHLEFFFLKIVCFFFYKWNQHLSYLDLFLGIFAFIMIGQIIIQEVPVPEIPARKWSGREREGAGPEHDSSLNWDLNSGHLLHNGAVCRRAAHKAIDADSSSISLDLYSLQYIINII